MPLVITEHPISIPMNTFTDNRKKRKHNTQPRNKRKRPRVVVYIPLFTGRDNDPPNRDSCSLLPNVYDPDFHCRVCDTTEANLSDYIKHLAIVHQIDKEGHVRKKKKMKATYKEDRFSSKNLLKVEEDDEEKEETIISYDDDSEVEEIIISDDDNDDTYEGKEETDNDDEDEDYDLCVFSNQRRRSRRISTKESTPEEVDPNAKPDINDPNHYCHACRKRHATRGAYRFHLKKVHQIQNIPIKPRDLHGSGGTAELDFIPDMDDEDNTLIDQLVNTTAIKKQQPLSIAIKKKPLVDNESKHISNQYYCSTCKINLENTTRYQIHVRKYHPAMTNPGTTSNKDTDIKPDIKDPNFYCQSCKITKPNRRSYLTHLNIIHKITLTSTINK